MSSCILSGLFLLFRYIISFLLDSTLGLFIIYIGLFISQIIARKRRMDHLMLGRYGQFLSLVFPFYLPSYKKCIERTVCIETHFSCWYKLRKEPVIKRRASWRGCHTRCKLQSLLAVSLTVPSGNGETDSIINL